MNILLRTGLIRLPKVRIHQDLALWELALLDLRVFRRQIYMILPQYYGSRRPAA